MLLVFRRPSSAARTVPSKVAVPSLILQSHVATKDFARTSTIRLAQVRRLSNRTPAETSGGRSVCLWLGRRRRRRSIVFFFGRPRFDWLDGRLDFGT